MNKNKMSGDFAVSDADLKLLKNVDHVVLENFFGKDYMEEMKQSYELNYNFEKNLFEKIKGLKLEEAIEFLKNLDIDFIIGNNGYQGSAVGAPLSKVVIYHDSNYIIDNMKMTTEYMKELK